MVAVVILSAWFSEWSGLMRNWMVAAVILCACFSRQVLWLTAPTCIIIVIGRHEIINISTWCGAL